MRDAITYTYAKLAVFQDCQRRYQLRYGQQLPWPFVPLGEEVEAALDRGRQFHQMVHRHFLNLPLTSGEIRDVELHAWWLQFQKSPPLLPAGERLSEISLTIPLGDHLLTGRFDLLIVSEIEGQHQVQLFDWKTGKVQSSAELKDDWQTRLYLAMLAEGGGALLDRQSVRLVAGLDPDLISLTYWYVDEPQAPVTIPYNKAWHRQNWAEIQALVNEIDQKANEEIWPLTDDWTQCQRCGYQAYCGRHEAGRLVPQAELVDDEFVGQMVGSQIEPELP